MIPILRFTKHIPITAFDLCVGCYLLWGLLNMLFIAGLPLYNLLSERWLMLLAIYIIARTINNKNLILWSIILVGVAQALCTVGQQIGYIASNHSSFRITGFMGNPGQLGGFQAVALICTFLTPKKISSILRKLRIILILLIGYSLWLADSRAGLIAVIAGLLIVFRQNIRTALQTRKWIFIPIAIITIGLSALIFNYRSDSANARLLIWRVSADMIGDKPLSGHGVGQFNRKYMLYQARYFKQNPDSKFIAVADNVAYPYNEFLHVFIEQGAVGLSILLILIFVAFRIAIDKKEQAPLAALLTFSFFSYPSYKFSLLVLYPILSGSISSKKVTSVSPKWGYPAAFIIVMTAAILTINGFRSRKQLLKNTQVLLAGYNASAANHISTRFDEFYLDSRFNGIYVYFITQYPQMADKAKFNRIIPTCENWCDIGNYYIAKDKSDKAELYYKTAACMIPTRLTPNYLLWKLYLKTSRPRQAEYIAKHILAQPLKVENTFTIRAKSEIKDFYRKGQE